MFKKPPTISSSHKISGSDRKKLRKSLQAAFPAASEDDIAAILPAKDGELSVGKVQSSRMQIYFLDDEPIIVDPSSKGDFFPTVFSLWRAPTLLPTVTVKHPAVTKFVVGGADLMLPGVDTDMPMPKLEKGDLCAVLSPGNPAPLAVGEVAISSDDVFMAAGKGRFLRALHHYRDSLWSMTEKQKVPNEGYCLDGVVPVDGSLQDLDGFETEETGERPPDSAIEQTHDVTTTEPDISSLQIQYESSTEPATPDLESSTPEDMDTLIRLSFLQVLTTKIDDTMLPIMGGKLWSDFMVPNRPPGSHLDMKKSSYKKLSKFLKLQKDAGLISCKEDKRSNDTAVTKVSRSHKDLADFTPYSLTEPSDAPAPAAPAPSALPERTDESATKILPLEIDEVFTTGSQKEVGIVFSDVVGPNFKNSCYRDSEVRQVVHDYIKKHGLQQDGRGQVQLDAHLCDALFKGLLKKGEPFPTHLSPAEIEDAFIKRMLPQQRVARGETQTLKKGNLSKVALQVKKRQGHTVTCVSGLEPFLIDARSFAQHVQRSCACAASCSELEGSKNKNCFEVTLQGDKSKQVSAILLTDFHIPKKYIQGA